MSTTFNVEEGFEELLAKNVPRKFNRLVDAERQRILPDSNLEQKQFSYRCAAVIGRLHPNPSVQNSLVLEERIACIMCVYEAMKKSVDQIVKPKDIAKELGVLNRRILEV